MDLVIREAKESDATIVGNMVIQLTEEISESTNTQTFDIDENSTIARCRIFIENSFYKVFIVFNDDAVIAMATISETYALYAGGKMGIIQEFYVLPEFRSFGVGAELFKHIKSHGLKREWSCLELCTPPLPEFERSVLFYQQNGFSAVGGRKMRISF